MQGINQPYYPGYSLELHRIVITPSEDDIPRLCVELNLEAAWGISS